MNFYAVYQTQINAKTEELCKEEVTNVEKIFKLWFNPKTFYTYETPRATYRMLCGRKKIYM